MELKLYLNKFLKVDNIEVYSLKTLKEMRSAYDKFLKDTEGSDPDFPGMSFGGEGKGQLTINNNEINHDGGSGKR